MQKKIPMRMCCGCNEMKPKRELIRILKTPEEEILIDMTGKKNGRGAYICKNLDCLKAARNTRRLERAFSCSISSEIYEGLENELSKQTD